MPSANASHCCPSRLLVKCHHPIVKESLHLLGVLGRRVLCWHPGREYTTTAALLWPEPAPCGGARPASLNLLRRVALPRPLRPSTSRDEWARGAVLLHERHFSRRLLNHEEVLRQLRHSLPSVSVVNGSGSLRQQISTFRDARCQVGPHGAGLALMLFAPSPWFGTAEVTPGAYFVTVKGKGAEVAADPTTGFHFHLNRNRDCKGSHTVTAPRAFCAHCTLSLLCGRQSHEPRCGPPLAQCMLPWPRRHTRHGARVDHRGGRDGQRRPHRCA